MELGGKEVGQLGEEDLFLLRGEQSNRYPPFSPHRAVLPPCAGLVGGQRLDFSPTIKGGPPLPR